MGLCQNKKTKKKDLRQNTDESNSITLAATIACPFAATDDDKVLTNELFFIEKKDLIVQDHKNHVKLYYAPAPF